MAPWLSKWRRRSTLSTPVSSIEEPVQKSLRKEQNGEQGGGPFQRFEETLEIPQTQSTLLLHAIRTPYVHTSSQLIPSVQHPHEILVKVLAVGLNPIDWKAPDYNFGIPTLPYISGRELVGTIITAPTTEASSRQLRPGDIVLIPSTDYRDLRKAAFQAYAITSSFNAIRLPTQISVNEGAILGVAFASAVLALGICMGLSFSSIFDGPDLLSIVRGIEPERLPSDIRKECLEGISVDGRAQAGDWLVIWGGSSTVAHTMKQLARLAGLRIISVVDSSKHGLRLSQHGAIRPDLVVDSHDSERAVSVIRAATGENAKFGFDTQGKDTAAYLARAIAPSSDFAAIDLPKDLQEYEAVKSKLPTPPSTPSELAKSATHQTHLVGLTGVPKTDVPEGVSLHNVPIKLFHEIPEIGEALSAWCEKLLARGLIVPPDVVGTVDGLEGINDGLDRLRKREISGGRLVAVLK